MRAGSIRRLAVVLAALTMAGGAGTAWGADQQAAPPASMADRLVPEPATVVPSNATYRLTPDTIVHVSPGARAVADQLTDQLRRSTGYPLPVIGRPGRDGISLTLARRADLGTEGYQLDVTTCGIAITANQPAGLFYGVQTLRQLLPATADATHREPGPWLVPGGHIVDKPRFTYRGAMLDVSRHFFALPVVEHYIDEISSYKINYLHLHLSDDQGWRIVINGWPNLTTYGGSTEVGGGRGGYYTHAQYEQLIAYAQAHYVTIVPEIDGPGHTNAALASYAQLNCDGKAPPLYTGTDTGFSSLCVNKDVTYTFERDVLAQLAALTPGPYLHIGGDEAQSTTATDYADVREQGAADREQRAQDRHGVARHRPGQSADVHGPGVLGHRHDRPGDGSGGRPRQQGRDGAGRQVLPGHEVHAGHRLGQNWAAYIEVKDAYGWDPGNYLAGVTGSSVLGVEAPLWSETLVDMANIEYMAFPRLPAIAELGWSPESTHDWASFRQRLGAQGPRWTVEGINFYASPQVPWAPGSKGGTD